MFPACHKTCYWVLVFSLLLHGAPGFGQAAVAPAKPEPAVVPARYITEDSHLHFVDFLQRSDGAEALLAAMDRVGVQRTMVCGMPLVKKWEASAPRQPLYYLEDDARCYWYSATDVLVARSILAQPTKDQQRFLPFIGGFNPTDLNAIDHIRRMDEWYPGFWRGIGEVMCRHDDLTALTMEETPRANHPALDPVYRFAAERRWPVAIHSNIGSVWVREPIYLHELLEAVSRHPQTQFIWNHAGISRRIKIDGLTNHLADALAAHANLSIDISWVVFEDYIAPEGVPSAEWIALLERFPDRFLFGTDKVARFHNYEAEVTKYYVLFDRLSPAVAEKVARGNFARLLAVQAEPAR